MFSIRRPQASVPRDRQRRGLAVGAGAATARAARQPQVVEVGAPEARRRARRPARASPRDRARSGTGRAAGASSVAAWLLPSAANADVERVGHHALRRRPLDAVVDHVREHVRVDDVALAEQQEAARQRQRPLADAVDHDVAGDPLRAVVAGDDRRGDRRVVRARRSPAASATPRRASSGRELRRRACCRSRRRTPRSVRRCLLQLRRERRRHQRGQAQRAVELPPPEHLAAVRLRLDEAEVDAAEPHHRPEVRLQLGRVGVVAARLELREVLVALDAEQARPSASPRRGVRLGEQRRDLGRRRRPPPAPALPVEQPERDRQVEVQRPRRSSAPSAASAPAASAARMPAEQRLQRRAAARLISSCLSISSYERWTA